MNGHESDPTIREDTRVLPVLETQRVSGQVKKTDLVLACPGFRSSMWRTSPSCSRPTEGRARR